MSRSRRAAFLGLGKSDKFQIGSVVAYPETSSLALDPRHRQWLVDSTAIALLQIVFVDVMSRRMASCTRHQGKDRISSDHPLYCQHHSIRAHTL